MSAFAVVAVMSAQSTFLPVCMFKVRPVKGEKLTAEEIKAIKVKNKKKRQVSFMDVPSGPLIQEPVVWMTIWSHPKQNFRKKNET